MAFLGGLVIGSFLTVVAYRVPRGESVVGGRSHCPGCGAQIAAYDNVPVFSWLILRGRARCCGERIGLRYPLTELALGLLWAAAVVVLHEDTAAMVLAMALIATLVVVTLTDLELRIIPNKILLVSAPAAVVLGLALDPAGEPERLVAGLAAGALLLLIAIIYPRGMGMGDVKLVAVMGLYLGRAVAPALLIGIAAGALIGLGMMLAQGSKARKKAIPFGPFLALGGVIGALWGNELLDLYLDSFSN
jgi:leader peptidase (prepilin peptidase)/N-methyltransferase